MPCSFAFGGRGIYFGGKDVLVSELSGAFAITAETDKADRHGVFKSARISVQFGGAQLASAQRYLLRLNWCHCLFAHAPIVKSGIIFCA